jgi:hypothetical protein
MVLLVGPFTYPSRDSWSTFTATTVTRRSSTDNSKYGWKIQDAALNEYRMLMDPSWLTAQIQRAMRQPARAGRSRKR